MASTVTTTFDTVRKKKCNPIFADAGSYNDENKNATRSMTLTNFDGRCGSNIDTETGGAGDQVRKSRRKIAILNQKNNTEHTENNTPTTAIRSTEASEEDVEVEGGGGDGGSMLRIKTTNKKDFVPAGPPGSMELLDQALSAPPFWGLHMKEGDTEIDMVWVDGPAHESGVLPKDFIRTIDGTPVERYEEVLRAVKASKVGEKVVITCERFMYHSSATLITTSDNNTSKATHNENNTSGSGTTTSTITEYTIVPKTANEAFASFPEIYFDLTTHTRIPIKEPKKEKRSKRVKS